MEGAGRHEVISLMSFISRTSKQRAGHEDDQNEFGGERRPERRRSDCQRISPNAVTQMPTLEQTAGEKGRDL